MGSLWYVNSIREKLGLSNYLHVFLERYHKYVYIKFIPIASKKTVPSYLSYNKLLPT